MSITDLYNNGSILLLEHLNIDPNKFDINNNLVLLYYKIKHGKQYAFLTDKYCIRCIYYYNKFESTNDMYIITHINDFTDHVLSNHYYNYD